MTEPHNVAFPSYPFIDKLIYPGTLKYNPLDLYATLNVSYKICLISSRFPYDNLMTLTCHAFLFKGETTSQRVMHRRNRSKNPSISKDSATRQFLPVLPHVSSHSR